MILGQGIRELRENKGMLLRESAAKLQIDTAMISRIERGEKSCKREHNKKLSKLQGAYENELTILWLSDCIFPIVEKEQFGIEALDQVKKRLIKS